MRTKKYIKQYLLLAFIAVFAVSCFDNVPSENELPRPPLAFTYRVVDADDYRIDFYVYSMIEFINESYVTGTATWNFGDGSAPVTGDVVRHSFRRAGLYQVRLSVDGHPGYIQQPIMINDIVPILTIAPLDTIMFPDGLIEVLNTPVIINARVPQPEAGMSAEFLWIFPPGTLDAAGVNPITTSNVPNPFAEGQIAYGGVTFSGVGSQLVRLQVRLDGRLLDEGRINVQVAYNQEVPTLYFAVRGGNIMALKIPTVPNPAISIAPFDMGVSAGRTPFNILFHENEAGGELFILDTGARFTFPTGFVDTDTHGGDGRIRVMSPDGMRVSTVIENRGHPGNDPYFAHIHGSFLYYSDRNFGIVRIPLDTRNAVSQYARIGSVATNTVSLPRWVSNQTIGYFCTYAIGMAGGALNSSFFRVGDVWWWGKISPFQSRYGIYRFTERDIRTSSIWPPCDVPFPDAGPLLQATAIRALLWDDINNFVYFTTTGENSGIFRATVAQLEAATAAVTGTGAANIEPFRLTMNGENLTAVDIFNDQGAAIIETIGIPQLALDRATGNVYFGFRSGNPNIESGILRVNGATGNVERVLYIDDVTAVAINNRRSKLF